MKLNIFQVIILAFFALAAIIGIIVFAGYSGKGPGQDKIGQVVIWGVLDQSKMNNFLNSAKNSRNDFDKVSYKQIDADSFVSTFVDALASGTGPDLILVPDSYLVTLQNKIREIPYKSISERVWQDTFIDGSDIYLTSTGTYAVPVAVDPLVMYFNKSHLSSAGVATTPTNWEAFLGLAEKLVQRDANQNISRSAVALGSYDNVNFAREIISALFLQTGSKITAYKNGQLQSTLSGKNSGASSVARFYSEFANPNKQVYSWNVNMPEARKQFLAGDLTFYFAPASDLPAIAKGNPNLNFDVAAFPEPGLIDTPVTYGSFYGLMIPRATGNASGAYNAAVAIAGKNLAQEFYKDFSMSPVRRDIIGTDNSLYQSVFDKEALIARSWLSPAPSATNTIFKNMVTSVVTGLATPADAVDKASDSINEAL